MIEIPKEIDKMIVEMQFPSCTEIERDTEIKILSIEKYIPGCPESYYRNISGTYILVTKKGRYIGESTAAVGLIHRLKQHKYSSRFNDDEILFGYIYVTTKDKKTTRKLESYLISKLKPDLNFYKPMPDGVRLEPVVRSTRQQGGSTVISLTGFVEEGEFYDIKKLAENVIILTKLELDKMVG